ncbi:MAG: hypothetical protein M9938_06270 [Solirubrobacterales bacterium]|nr:hypothetical protein [Solirubrobacterales bacterium]
MGRVVAGFLSGLLVSMVFAVGAQAASVAYLDKGGVWVSSLDGKQKRKIASKTRDGRKWTELAQSDNGRIVAVRREPGKISNINRFQIWSPTGKPIHLGILSAETGWTSYAYPLSLDLTADGRNVVYGYSNYNYGYPVGTLENGTYVLYADRYQTTPFKITDESWPTTVGNRLVTARSQGTVTRTIVDVQRTTGQPPWSQKFDPWIDISATGYELQRTDVAANRKLVAVEGVKWGGDGAGWASAIVIARINGPGSTLTASCVLPTKGEAGDVSISQDGKSLAWHDRRGVVVAGAPTFGGTDTCKLKRRVKVISKTAKQPSIGNAKVKVKKKRKRR